MAKGSNHHRLPPVTIAGHTPVQNNIYFPRPSSYAVPTGWEPYPSGAPPILYTQRVLGRAGPVSPPASRGSGPQFSVAGASALQGPKELASEFLSQRHTKATDEGPVATIRRKTYPPENNVRQSLPAPSPRPSTSAPTRATNASTSQSTPTSPPPPFFAEDFFRGTSCAPINVDDDPQPTPSVVGPSGGKRTRGEFARRILEDSMPPSARTMGRSNASIITTVAPASVQPTQAPSTGRKRKRTNAEGGCDAAPSSSAPKSSTSNRKRQRVKKAAPAKASSLPAVAKTPSSELPTRDSSTPTTTKDVETSTATTESLPARPATAPPQVASPGPVVAAVEDPLASPSERGQPEPESPAAAPPTEAVAPSVAKRPQSTTPPVVAASLNFFIGTPPSVEPEDDLCDLFGDPLDDDSV